MGGIFAHIHLCSVQSQRMLAAVPKGKNVQMFHFWKIGFVWRQARFEDFLLKANLEVP